MTDHRAVPLCIAGAAPDTGNLGVSALLYGILEPLHDRIPGFAPTVFDYGSGVRSDIVDLSSGAIEMRRCGAYLTRRFYRSESLMQIRMAARLGGLNNPAARSMGRARGILDVSGGDSFTDLYGSRRFRSITLPKVIALEMGTPLFLLPQTYGPFTDPGHRTTAQMVLRRSRQAWARDERSYDVLHDLLGDAFDPGRHRVGVDVAFLLQSKAPDESPPDSLRAMLESPGSSVVGINVSGLLYNRSEEAAERFGFKADYRSLITDLVGRFLSDSDCSVVLVPHVIPPEGHYESDRSAADHLVDQLDVDRNRVVVAPAFKDPRHAKWLISKVDWFCGTRMHSAIAALSSGVACAAVAYSDKTRGVFETCDQGDYVADPRSSGTQDVVDELWDAWKHRDRARARLRAALPAVIEQANSQMDAIAGVVTEDHGNVGVSG